MNTVKEIAALTAKVVLGLVVLSFGLSAVGVNLFGLIASPVGTIKGLFTPAAKA